MASNEFVHRWGLAAPVIGIVAGGVVDANLPEGLFGEYDIPLRAAVTGIVAGVTALSILMIVRKANVKR